jgi:hypothetical protein
VRAGDESADIQALGVQPPEGGPADPERDALRAERDSLRAERDALRARLDDLEHERAAEMARASEAVAAAQERVYWLDRWHMDLGALLISPQGVRIRALTRALWRPLRWLLGFGRRSEA